MGSSREGITARRQYETSSRLRPCLLGVADGPLHRCAVKIENTSSGAFFQQKAIRCFQGGILVSFLEDGRLPGHDPKTAMFQEAAERWWSEKPQMMHCRIMTPAMPLEVEQALKSLDSGAHSRQVGDANIENAPRMEQFPAPLKLRKRILSVFQHVVKAHDIESQSAKVNSP